MKISAKGQVVIPADYRERLNIEPGTEVSVRIRGQFLFVEIDTDIAGDVEFLRGLNGKLGEKDFDITGAEEIVRDLLSQQFYEGKDLLVDRIGQKKEKIRGSDTIINEAIRILTQASRHWFEGDYVTTIEEFADDLDLDFGALLNKYVMTVKNMLPGDDMSMLEMMGGEVFYAMAVSSTLTLFREKVGDLVTERIIKQAEAMGEINRLGKDTVEELITRSLAEKYSILMNLRTLKELARVSVKSTGERKFREYSESLFQDLQEMDTPDHVIKRKERTYRRRMQRAREAGKTIDEEEVKRELGLLDIREHEKSSDEEDEVSEESNNNTQQQPKLPDMNGFENE